MTKKMALPRKRPRIIGATAPRKRVSAVKDSKSGKGGMSKGGRQKQTLTVSSSGNGEGSSTGNAKGERCRRESSASCANWYCELLEHNPPSAMARACGNILIDACLLYMRVIWNWCRRGLRAQQEEERDSQSGNQSQSGRWW
jgi:hypothetical protein